MLGVAAIGGIGAIIYAVLPGSSPTAAILRAGGPGASGVIIAGSAASGRANVPVPGPMPGAPSGRAAQHSGSAPTPIRPSSSTLVASWNRGPGGKALLAVTAQSGNVMMAHGAGQYPAMLHYCALLTGSVQTAKAAAPIPDFTMQKAYAAALADFARGAADCQNAITQHAAGVEEVTTSVNQPLIKQAVSELGLGTSELYIATAALRRQ